MKNLYEIIRRPLITEKATIVKETQNAVCFEVHRDATKPEIKKAVEALFSVKVADVRVARVLRRADVAPARPLPDRRPGDAGERADLAREEEPGG